MRPPNRYCKSFISIGFDFLNILYLDTATEACTVGVWRDGAVFSRFELAPRAHTQWLLPMVESVLNESGLSFALLDGIAFNRGPGSFTGVRIAVAAALGMAMGHDLPVLGLSSLAVLAQSESADMAEGEIVHAALDARMGEVYHGAFQRQDGRLVPVVPELVISPARLLDAWRHPTTTNPERALGSGFGRYPALIQSKAWRSVATDRYPDARDGVVLAALAEPMDWQSPDQAAPVYLRDDVATPKSPVSAE